MPLGRDERFALLAPTDMALCAATQVFCGHDLDTALRDLSDLDLLLRRFGQNADFWPALTRRADGFSLRSALDHGLRWSNALLGTPIPPAPLSAATRRDAASLLRDAIWRRALRPQHETTSERVAALARRTWRWRAGRLEMDTS
jgi:hypothetical protein